MQSEHFRRTGRKENLSYLRRLNNYSQQELAKAAGVTRSAYANYENGAREPNLNVLIRLADFYGISLDDLVGHRAAGQENAAVAAERQFLESYRKLSQTGKRRIRHLVEFELSAQE